MRKFIKAPTKFYFHYPFPVAVIATKYEDKINLMSAVWHTQLSFDPPLYGVSISPKRFSFELINKAKVFTVNFLDFEFVETVSFVGSVSGREIDKAHAFDIPLSEGRLVDAPILDESYAAYECELVEAKKFGDHTLFVGRILGVHYEENFYYGEKFYPDMEKIYPTLYIGDETYITTDPSTKKRYTKDEALKYLKDWRDA